MEGASCQGLDCPCSDEGACPAGMLCDDESRQRGVPDAEDICPELADADQEDRDSDGQGNVCDPDDDDDGVDDNDDNCPLTPNPDQTNTDGIGDGGDACDDDDDNDTILDDAEADFGTDPKDADTDDDGSSDIEEIRVGTDPTRAEDRPGRRRPANAVLIGGGCQTSPSGGTPTAPLGLMLALGGLWILSRRRRQSAAVLPALALAAIALMTPTHAQAEGFDSLRFKPTGIETGGLTLVGTPTLTPLNFNLSVFWLFADTPVQLASANDRGEILLPVVDRENYLDLKASIGIIDGLVGTLEVPVLVERSVGEDFADDIDTAAFGDLDLRGRYSLFEREREAFGVAGELILTFPTGSEKALTGSGSFSGGFNLIADGTFGPLTPVINVGFRVRPERSFVGTVEDDLITYGVAARYAVLPAEKLTVIGEWSGSASTSDLVPGNEVGLAALTSFFGLGLSAGATVGLGDQVGVPSFRVFAGLSFVTGGSITDRDGDGLTGPADLCPELAEDFDGFEDNDGCPESDNDGDGLADAVDACPSEAEDKDGFKDDDGCPEDDNDGDGLADGKDKCPDQAEDKDGYKDEDGCPDLDNDGDGIPDTVDQCPVKAETANGFRDEDGCPDQAPKYVFKKDVPLILYSIEFKSGSDILLDESSTILDDLASSLQTQDDLRVRVEGHTDDQGNDSKNLELSQRRALRVVNALVERGIDKRRLTYEGYGESRPLVPNKDTDSRAKNRRVEFLVVP